MGETGWRYQPVICTGHGESYVTLVEVYLDADGKLTSWQQDPDNVAYGEDADSLREVLLNMLAASCSWEPVEFDGLVVGQTFSHRGKWLTTKRPHLVSVAAD